MAFSLAKWIYKMGSTSARLPLVGFHARNYVFLIRFITGFQIDDIISSGASRVWCVFGLGRVYLYSIIYIENNDVMIRQHAFFSWLYVSIWGQKSFFLLLPRMNKCLSTTTHCITSIGLYIHTYSIFLCIIKQLKSPILRTRHERITNTKQ